MDEERQDDHLEPKYNSSVPIRDERGSGISMLIVRHDNDDNDDDDDDDDAQKTFFILLLK